MKFQDNRILILSAKLNKCDFIGECQRDYDKYLEMTLYYIRKNSKQQTKNK